MRSKMKTLIPRITTATLLFLPGLCLAAYIPLDFGSVTSADPNFSGQTLGTTTFDGQLITEGAIGITPEGQSTGDFRLGSRAGQTERYRLTFADPVELQFANALDTQFGGFGPTDDWTFSASGVEFFITDPGSPDLLGLPLSGPYVGAIGFQGNSSGGGSTGDGDWSITTGPLTSIDLIFRNTGAANNLSPMNIQASIAGQPPAPQIPAPATLALLGVGLISLFGASSRRIGRE